MLAIKIKDNKVLKLLHDLEDLNRIQVVSSNVETPAKRLSEVLSGSISTE